MEEKIKILLSILLGALSTFCKQYGVVILLVCIAVVFDTVTGIIASKVQEVPITSKKGAKGFFKKLTLILSLFFGIFMDFAVPMMLQAGLDIALPFNMPMGLIVGCYIILNEAISICENFENINPGMLPAPIVKLLKAGKESINKED